MDRGLGDVQDQQRADGDAELAGGQHQGGVLHRPQGGARGAVAFLGPGLDLGPSGGDHSEFGADEEGVDE
jgi:hypothetical protein